MMPPAVHEAGDVNINGVTVPNLLVVNERSLLYENIPTSSLSSYPFSSSLSSSFLSFHLAFDDIEHIGATQQLDKHLQIEKSNIVEIDSRVDHLASM